LEEPKPVPELDPSRYGLNSDARVPTLGLLDGPVKEIAVAELGTRLASLYCGPTAIETDHLENEGEQEWLHSRYQSLQAESLSPEQRVSLAGHLLRCQAFDNFLATKFQSVKRYGGEGAEAMMGFFTELLNIAKQQNLNQIVLGQAHRGRLNLLTGLLGFPPVAMFRKMRGLPEFPPDQYGAGDVLSHLTASLEVDGVRLTMLPNPSHLEAVNPVAAGKARAREMRAGRGQYGDERVGEGALCVQVHGDGALAGQGVNQETLQISQVPHYSVGGSLHLVVNNQVAFTAPGDRGRSSTHCTGLARQIEAPVIHVNGDCPEEVVKATRLAMEYRQKFRKDVFVDLVCFRRWGHNELDDPTMTNPALYAAIQARRSVPDLYSDSLISEGLLSQEERKVMVGEHMDWLSENFRQIESYQPERSNLNAQWSEMREPEPIVTDWDTGLPSDVLKFVGARSVKAPEDFNLHPQLKKTHVEARLKKLEAGTGLDWGTCEALAMGSLLYQGWNVRISGQDVGRATFAHRHAMLVDQDTNEIYIPLNDMVEEQKGKLEIANSILSEEAVLAFEYGMSVENPKNLIIWEAQFGDFFNGAQIILDTFVSSGESKWGLQSGTMIVGGVSLASVVLASLYSLVTRREEAGGAAEGPLAGPLRALREAEQLGLEAERGLEAELGRELALEEARDLTVAEGGGARQSSDANTDPYEQELENDLEDNICELRVSERLAAAQSPSSPLAKTPGPANSAEGVAFIPPPRGQPQPRGQHV